MQKEGPNTMMIFRRAILPIAFCAMTLACAATARADEAARQREVEQLFAVMHIEQTFNQMMQQVIAQNQSMVAGLFPEIDRDPKQKAEYDAFMARVMTMVQSSFSWKAMEPEYAKIYLDTYSDEEITGMLAFYDSPVGRSVLTKTPKVLEASSAVAMDRMNELTPKLREMMKTEMQKMKPGQSTASK